MKIVLLFLPLALVSCSNSSKDSGLVSNNDSFINYYKKNIDFSDCYLFWADEIPVSKAEEKRVSEFLERITKKGTKLINPMDVIEYNGHSKEIAFNYKDIQNISSEFNELFDEYLTKANELCEAKNMEVTSEINFSNGKLWHISKSSQDSKINCSKNYFENGSLKGFSLMYNDNFTISFGRLENGEYTEKKLTIWDERGVYMLFHFEERYKDISDFDQIGYYIIADVELKASVKNNNLARLNQTISCWCPDGKDIKEGDNKSFIINVIDYNEVQGITQYWENGKHITINDKKPSGIYDLVNNTYTFVEYMNDGKDTSSLLLGKLTFKDGNNQQILYGGIPSEIRTIMLKKTEWDDTYDGSRYKRYKRSETFFDENGYETEYVLYFPNGEIESRQKRN